MFRGCYKLPSLLLELRVKEMAQAQCGRGKLMPLHCLNSVSVNTSPFCGVSWLFSGVGVHLMKECPKD